MKNSHAVVIYSEAGSCGRPRILQVHPRYAGHSVYIRAEVEFQKEKFPKSAMCAGVGEFIYKTVNLKREIKEIKIYDSSVTPPALRWPE